MKIGLLGLGRIGTYHLERMSLRRDLKVVATCPVVEIPAEAQTDCGTRYTRIADLLARDDLDYVLVAVPQKDRAKVVIQALGAGKNVALVPPMGVNYDEARKMLATARGCGRNLSIIPARRDGLNFRIAQQVVQSTQLGILCSARMISWAKAVPEDFDDADDALKSLEAGQSEGTFAGFAFQYVDQVLKLFGRSPQSVFANIREVPTSDATAAAFLLSIVFPDGGDALIDVNLHSGAMLQTGWMLAGSRGAYCGQRIYLPEPSGEICDAPVSTVDLTESDPYAELLLPTKSRETEFLSAREAMAVMRVIDAARKSSRSGQTVYLNDEG